MVLPAARSARRVVRLRWPIVDVLWVALIGAGTAFATGLGVLPVWALGAAASRWRPALEGGAAGVMGVAAVVGLLLPAADSGNAVEVAGGAAAGIAFLLLARRFLGHHDLHVGNVSGAGVQRSLLVFGVLFVHSLPEGLAIGTAYASTEEGLGLFVILAIALQNVPEGTAAAIPMVPAGFSRRAQFWAAVGTSVPQPVGAVIAYVLVDQVEGLLPVSFAFAGAAMLTLVLVDTFPGAFAAGRTVVALVGAAAGAAIMLVLSAALGV
jgi:zinc transporter, ZIP family